VREDEILKNGLHEGVSAVFEETVDPELKAAMQCELRAKDFVLSKNQKEDANGNAQNGKRKCVTV